jgi:hypothetical protein
VKQRRATNLRRKVSGFLGLAALAVVMFISFFLALVIIPAPGPSAEQLAAMVAEQGPVQFAGILAVRSGEVSDRHRFQAQLNSEELRLDFKSEDFVWSFADGELRLGNQKLAFKPSSVAFSRQQLASRSEPGPEIEGQATWKLTLSGALIEGRSRVSPLLAPPPVGLLLSPRWLSAA